MSIENEIKVKQTTKHWPQYLAGASAAGGAFSLGTVLGIKLKKKNQFAVYDLKTFMRHPRSKFSLKIVTRNMEKNSEDGIEINGHSINYTIFLRMACTYWSTDS